MVSGKAALQPVINITKPLPAQVISVWSQARRHIRSRNGHCRLPGDKEQIFAPLALATARTAAGLPMRRATSP